MGKAPPLPFLFSRFALGDQPVKLLLRQVGHVDPGVGHLIDGAVTPPDPLLGIGVGGVVNGVVMPCRDDDRCSGW